MCTLIVAVGTFEDADVLVAANRDERLDRPAGPPRIHQKRDVPVLAPMDEQAGGTWLGLNGRGLFAGITNRFGNPPDPGRRSRGHLVFESLAFPDAVSAAQEIGSMEASSTNPFHLLLADRKDAWLVGHDGVRIFHQQLGIGIHVLTERSLGAAAGTRETWLKDRLKALGGSRAPGEDSLKELLSFHDPDDPFDGSCVHADWLGYGTRSACLLRYGTRLEEGRFLFAGGPPCSNRFEDLTPLLRRLATG